MTKILNVGSHSVDLDDGRVLAPGEQATVDIDDPHNKVLVDQGSVLVVAEPKQRSTSDSKSDDNKREDK